MVYLMLKHQRFLDDAYYIVKQGRPLIGPKNKFLRHQLMAIHDHLFPEYPERGGHQAFADTRHVRIL
jgi:hypothetical protein